MTKFAAALAFLGLNLYTYYGLATEPVIPPRTPFSEFPLELGEWACAANQPMEDAIRANLGVTDYLLCNYVRRPRDLVNVYVGYHETQIREEGGGAGENSIHPPAHCLPGSGWDIIDSRNVPLDLPGVDGKPRVKRLLIAKGEMRQLVYYWYQSRGRVIAADWQKIVFVGLDRALRGRTDGSLTRFSIPVLRGDEARAEAAFRDLASHVVSRLAAYVPE